MDKLIFGVAFSEWENLAWVISRLAGTPKNTLGSSPLG